MAGVIKTDIPEIAAFMTVFWGFVKKYWIPEDADSGYWAEYEREATEIAARYGNNRFCEKMLRAYAEYLEEKQEGHYRDGKENRR